MYSWNISLHVSLRRENPFYMEILFIFPSTISSFQASWISWNFHPTPYSVMSFFSPSAFSSIRRCSSNSTSGALFTLIRVICRHKGRRDFCYTIASEWYMWWNAFPWMGELQIPPLFSIVTQFSWQSFSIFTVCPSWKNFNATRAVLFCLLIASAISHFSFHLWNCLDTCPKHWMKNLIPTKSYQQKKTTFSFSSLNGVSEVWADVANGKGSINWSTFFSSYSLSSVHNRL